MDNVNHATTPTVHAASTDVGSALPVSSVGQCVLRALSGWSVSSDAHTLIKGTSRTRALSSSHASPVHSAASAAMSRGENEWTGACEAVCVAAARANANISSIRIANKKAEQSNALTGTTPGEQRKQHEINNSTVWHYVCNKHRRKVNESRQARSNPSYAPNTNVARLNMPARGTQRCTYKSATAATIHNAATAVRFRRCAAAV